MLKQNKSLPTQKIKRMKRHLHNLVGRECAAELLFEEKARFLFSQLLCKRAGEMMVSLDKKHCLIFRLM